MSKNDIRGRFEKNLFAGCIQKKRKEFKKIGSLLFPIEKGFHNFLHKSKEEQTEISKYILCDLGFSTFASPPNVFIRNLLSLQAKEKNVNTIEKYYPRDHVTHKLYLYLLGIYLYTYSDLFFIRINKKLSRIKKKYNLMNKDNFALFSSVWKHFSLFHDIGYPAERLSNEKLTSYINKYLIVDMTNIKECYLDEMVLKIISNLVAITTVTSDVENFDFNSQVYKHLNEHNKKELEKQLHKDSLDNLLKSKPYIHLTSLKHARLVSVINGENNIIAVAEDAVTGEILLICSLDNSVRLHMSECKYSDKIYKDIFVDDKSTQKYILKYYPISSEYSALNPLKEHYGDDFISNLQAVRAEVEQNKLYDTYQSGGNNVSDMLNYIAYSVISSDTFVDYDTKDRFAKKIL
jgi:hypothetical protein